MKQILIYLSLPVLCAALSAILIQTKPTPALQARRWLVRSMVCGALSIVLMAHYYHPTLQGSIALDWLYAAVQLCLAPCFYLCILSLTSLHGIRRRNYLIFVPGAVIMLLMSISELAMGADETREAIAELVLRTRALTEGHSWGYHMYAFFGNQFYRSWMLISLVAVFYWGGWAIHTYQKQLEDYLTGIPVSLTRGIRWLYLSFVLFSLSGGLMAACEYTQTLHEWFMPVFATGIAVSYLLMGHFAGQVKYSAETVNEWTVNEVSVNDGTVNEKEEDPFRERLAVIEREALYRDPNLTIFTLSRTIGTNRTYLTRAFREVYGESFSEHINRLRIEEAIRLMTESPQMPLHDIAARVGYNSPTSLYRNFVRIHGCAPSEYIK